MLVPSLRGLQTAAFYGVLTPHLFSKKNPPGRVFFLGCLGFFEPFFSRLIVNFSKFGLKRSPPPGHPTPREFAVGGSPFFLPGGYPYSFLSHSFPFLGWFGLIRCQRFFFGPNFFSRLFKLRWDCFHGRPASVERRNVYLPPCYKTKGVWGYPLGFFLVSGSTQPPPHTKKSVSFHLFLKDGPFTRPTHPNQTTQQADQFSSHPSLFC